jgi:hypothetical protein
MKFAMSVAVALIAPAGDMGIASNGAGWYPPLL